MKDFDDKKDELKSAPFLYSMGKKNVFKIPENYFADFPKDLGDKIEDAKVLEESPLLYVLEKRNIFQVPVGYFDSFSKRFTKKREKELIKKDKIKPLWSRPQYSISIAAAIVLLVSIGIWMGIDNQQADEIDPLAMLSEVPTDQLLASVDVSDYDLDMIIETMGEGIIENFGTISEIQISKEEASDMLDQIDVSDLEAELLEFLE